MKRIPPVYFTSAERAAAYRMIEKVKAECAWVTHPLLNEMLFKLELPQPKKKKEDKKK